MDERSVKAPRIVVIIEDDLSGEKIRRFLAEHVNEMYSITPAGSAHALDLDGLKQPGVTFWSIWEGDHLLGCGALKLLDSITGEIKSMRTAPDARRRGVGSALLKHIAGEARRRNLSRLCLETGSFEAFRPARSLYERHGFGYRGPFGPYRDDPNSVFMVLNL